jgi:dTDP-4-amino-4,6-dideoxygalactose transaminase
MQILQAPRASAILYGILIADQEKHPWLLPANICPIVPITFLKAGVPFWFVDISAETLHMDLEQAEVSIKERKFGGLLYAHTYGEAATPNHFFESIKRESPKLLIVDDRCLCIPDLKPEFANQADVQLYSTGYAKIVELNSGGYAFMRDDINYQPAHLSFNPADHERMERSYKESIGRRVRFVHQDSDWLDTESPVSSWSAYQQHIEANLRQSLEHRVSLNQIYAGMLPREIQLPAGFQVWRFNIRVRNKQRILDRIFSAGLFASSHYASLADIMGEEHAPHAEALAESVINLFNDRHFTPDQAEQVCKIILENLA